MSREFWTHVADACKMVSHLPPESRTSALKTLYPDRDDVVNEVESLLRYESAANQIDRSVVMETAAEMLYGSGDVVGTIVGGKYLVRERIGSGATSEVF